MDKITRAKRVLKNTEKYSGLWANPDFQDWRKNVVNKRLKALNNKILTAKINTEDGKKNALEDLLRYQILKYETDYNFKKKKNTEDMARNIINKLKDK